MYRFFFLKKEDSGKTFDYNPFQAFVCLLEHSSVCARVIGSKPCSHSPCIEYVFELCTYILGMNGRFQN